MNNQPNQHVMPTIVDEQSSEDSFIIPFDDDVDAGAFIEQEFSKELDFLFLGTPPQSTRSAAKPVTMSATAPDFVPSNYARGHCESYSLPVSPKLRPQPSPLFQVQVQQNISTAATVDISKPLVHFPAGAMMPMSLIPDIHFQTSSARSISYNYSMTPPNASPLASKAAYAYSRSRPVSRACSPSHRSQRSQPRNYSRSTNCSPRSFAAHSQLSSASPSHSYIGCASPMAAPVAFNFPAPEPLPSKILAMSQQRGFPDFAKMSTEQILNGKYTVKQLIKYDLVVRLMRDQIGSRYLQKEVKKVSDRKAIEDVQKLCVYLVHTKKLNLTKMAEDIYGNYMVQLLFKRGNAEQHEFLLNNFVYRDMLRLCKSKYGCRVVQEILMYVKSKQSLIRLAKSLETQCSMQQHIKIKSERYSLDDCLHCCNVNRVLQVLLDLKLPYSSVKFIGDQLESKLFAYSEHKNACRVVQSFIIQYGDKLNVMKLLKNEGHIKLCDTIHGNYVVQCIIRKQKWYSNQPMFVNFREQFIYDVFHAKVIERVSKNKFGSNVIETCIRCASEAQLDYLVRVLTRKSGKILSSVMAHEFGNYVPKTLLAYASQKQKRMIVECIDRHIVDLTYPQYNRSFKHCTELIMKARDFKNGPNNSNHGGYRKKE